MDLSSELISQFVKATKDTAPKTSEATIYGTTVEYNGTVYVKLDGSERLTPVETTVALEPNERVTVLVKNHTATVTGNISSPAARNSDVEAIKGTIAEFDTVIADKIDAKTANIELAIIDKLDGKYATFDVIEAAEAEIDILKADNVTINQKLTARDAEIDQLKANSLTVEVADAKYATIENLNGTNARFNNLESTYGEFKIATVDRLDAIEADIENLDVGNLDAKYATVTRLQAAEAEIDTLQANMLVADDLKALEADIADLNANKLSAKDADIKYATIAVLQSDYITAAEIAATYITASAVAANYAKISTLESDYIKTTDLEANYITAAMINSKYAEIDLANVDRASIGTVLANIGLITSATIVDGHVTGYLDSVEVNANNITAGTLTVDRLIISGSDKSIIYAINNAGELTSTETDTIDGDVITKRTIAADHIIAGAITANEIHSSAVTADKIATNAVTADKIAANAITSGKIAANAITADKIAADAVTADKINVVDLKALGATIGTFNIGDKSIYSGTKSTVSNTSRGIYMDTDGQLNFGDNNNYLKFYKDQNNVYKLAIAAESLTFGSGTSVADAFNDVASDISTAQTTANNAVNVVNNLQVGGRNLLLNSARVLMTGSDQGSNTYTSTIENDYVKIVKTSNGNVYNNTGGIKTAVTRKKGEQYTVSFEVLAPTNIGFYWYPSEKYNDSHSGTHISASSEWQKVSFTYTQTGADASGSFLFGFYSLVAGETYCYRNLKLEKGNKATDWTPAPEDVDAGILNVQTTANNAQATANTANTAATNAVNAVNNIKVGGRNLLRFTGELPIGTTRENGVYSWAGNTVLTKTADGIKLNYTTVGEDCIGLSLANDGIVKSGDTLTLSFDYRGTITNFGAFYFIQRTPPNTGLVGFPSLVANETEWQHYEHTFTATNANSRTCYSILMLYGASKLTTDWIEIKKGSLKLEKGNKATDWTPAPEDTVTRVDVMYVQSDSATTAPTSGWTTTAPTWTNGKYIWTKTVSYSGSVVVSESTPVCITGAKGATGSPGSPGSTGVGISSITELYYAGPSTTVPSAPTAAVTTNNASTYVSWNKAMPTYSASYPHYFTCSQVYYTNGTYKWTTPVYAGALTSANATANTAATNATNALNTANNIQVGGRNYFSTKTQNAQKFDSNGEFRLHDYQNVGSFTQFYNLTVPMSTFHGKECVLSFDIISPNGETPLSVYNTNGNARYVMNITGIISPISTSWTSQKLKVTVTDRGSSYNTDQSNKIEIYCSGKMGCKIRNVKFEIGNKATDWTPAPEDVASDISNAQTSANNAQTTAENAQSAANNAHATADTAQSTANAANTAAGIAQTTANNAQTSANNAQSTADKADIMAATAQGKMLHRDPTFKSGTNGCLVYNNSGNGNVTVELLTTQSTDNPYKGYGRELKISNKGAASPVCGGYNQTFMSRAYGNFIYRIVAKIPVGRNLTYHTNSVGTGASTTWHTPVAGTGKFEEYIIEITCGTSGTFSAGGYFAIDGNAGTASAPVVWYVAYSTCFDMTNNSDILEAAKTATNHMNFDSTNGLVISQDATANSGNVQIKSDGFRIRNGTTVNASFLGNTITLGQNSSSSSINLCGDKGTIKINENQFGRDALTIMAEDVELYSDVSTSMLCKPGVTSGGYSSTYSYCHANYESFTLGSLSFKFPVARLGTYGVSSSGANIGSVEAGPGTVALEGSIGSNKSTLYLGSDGLEAYSTSNVTLKVHETGIDPYIEITDDTTNNSGYGKIYMTANTITINPIASATIDSPATVTGLLTTNSGIHLPHAKAITVNTTSTNNAIAVDTVNGAEHIRFGYGTYVAGKGRTEIVGNDIVFWTKRSTTSLKPYYAAGDSFLINGVVGGLINDDGYKFEFAIPLSKPIMGSPAISVTTGNGVIVKQNGKYLYGGSSGAWNKNISTLTPQRLDDNTIHLQVKMSNYTNVTTNCECGIAYHLYVTLS